MCLRERREELWKEWRDTFFRNRSRSNAVIKMVLSLYFIWGNKCDRVIEESCCFRWTPVRVHVTKFIHSIRLSFFQHFQVVFKSTHTVDIKIRSNCFRENLYNNLSHTRLLWDVEHDFPSYLYRILCHVGVILEKEHPGSFFETYLLIWLFHACSNFISKTDRGNM